MSVIYILVVGRRQVANAEILNMSLLMEDVLLSGFVEKSVFLRTDDSPLPEVNQQRRGSMSRRMSIATPTQKAAAASAERKGSDASRRMSDVGGQCLLVASCCVHMQCYTFIHRFLVSFSKVMKHFVVVCRVSKKVLEETC